MPRLLLPLLCLCLLLAGPAGAQIYSWTDADGNRVYSDQPRPGASTIELKPTNVVEPTPAPPVSSRGNTQGDRPSGPVYQRLMITNPAHDTALRSNEGDLTLTVVTEPPLSGSHLLKVSIDGQRSEEHTSELQSRPHLVCRLLLEKKKKITNMTLYAL